MVEASKNGNCVNAFCKCRIPYISVFKKNCQNWGNHSFHPAEIQSFLVNFFSACILTQEPNCTGAEAGEPRSGVPAQQPGVQPAAPAALLPPAAGDPHQGGAAGRAGGGAFTGLLAPAGGLV